MLGCALISLSLVSLSSLLDYLYLTKYSVDLVRLKCILVGRDCAESLIYAHLATVCAENSRSTSSQCSSWHFAKGRERFIYLVLVGLYCHETVTFPMQTSNKLPQSNNSVGLSNLMPLKLSYCKTSLKRKSPSDFKIELKTYHVNGNLSNVCFAIFLFEVLDPGLFFWDKVWQNIL